jgi:hypothetical protein
MRLVAGDSHWDLAEVHVLPAFLIPKTDGLIVGKPYSLYSLFSDLATCSGAPQSRPVPTTASRCVTATTAAGPPARMVLCPSMYEYLCTSPVAQT